MSKKDKPVRPDSRFRGNDKKNARGNRRVPRPAEQDQGRSVARACRLAEPAGRQAVDLRVGHRKATAPRPCAGRPQGCRSREGKQGVACGVGHRKPQVPGAAEQDKGRRPRAEGAGPAAQKPRGFSRPKALNNRLIPHPKHLAPIFCAAGSGIFIPPPAP